MRLSQEVKMVRLLLPLSAIVCLALAGSDQQQCAPRKPKESTEIVLSSDHELVVRCGGSGQQSRNAFPLIFNSIGANISDVSTRGREIWIAKKDESIYRYVNGQWKRIFGTAAQVAASADGWAWHVTPKKDEVYRYNPSKKAWDRMPGALIQVSALSKDVAIGVNREKDLYFWRNDKWEKYARTPGSLPNGAIWASIGQNDTAWAIGPAGMLWRWDPKEHKFKQHKQAAVSVDVLSADRIVAVTKENHVLQYDPKTNTWKQLAEKTAKRASVGDQILFTIDAAGVLSAHGL